MKIVICPECKTKMKIEDDNKILHCKCGKKMMTQEELDKPKPIVMCSQCKKREAMFGGLCDVCDAINSLVNAGFPKPSLKSSKKIRWREGNFDYIENNVGHQDIKHKLRHKNTYCGELDRQCRKLTINELDSLLASKNHNLIKRWDELNKQLKITQEQYDERLTKLKAKLKKKSITRTKYKYELDILNSQLNEGTLTNEEHTYKKREINCEFEIIRDWKKLKQKQKGIL